MPSCAAIDCKNRSGTGIKFYNLPRKLKKPELRKRWLDKIKRNGSVPSDENFHICDAHFDESCYERDLKTELMQGKEGAMKLKEDAVPTIFTFSRPKQKRTSSIARIDKKPKKELLEKAIKVEEEDCFFDNIVTGTVETSTDAITQTTPRPRTVNKSTQYEDLSDIPIIEPPVPIEKKLTVKFPFAKPKRTADIEVKTEPIDR